MTNRIYVVTRQITADTVGVEVKDHDNDTVGYLEITRVPVGAGVDAWNGDDSKTDEQIILRKKP